MPVDRHQSILMASAFQVSVDANPHCLDFIDKIEPLNRMTLPSLPKLSIGIGARERREDTEESRAVRIEKIAGAVRTILHCIGEDPDREGLLKTPERYAKALMFFSKGYEESVTRKIQFDIEWEGEKEGSSHGGDRWRMFILKRWTK